ncbi:VWA domain-containing protein [Sphingomonas sp. AAP5]|uniref:vWA domain-containing protein n=1 Tax=Sphingomonas sp. AAP5 TaxID=1523415 RepID=UPI001056E9E4|nr:VWA domain-containing protein [Sphingomonas sp. AAP5]QBM75168.1 VWA domain-containing protein [Sphingomonas sp. AAP5]
MDDFSHHVSDDQQPFGDMEFADNPEPRAACLLLLDTSGSMKGEAIAALNAGLLAFAEALRADRLSAKRVDVAVIKFGETAEVVQEFVSAEAFHPQPLKANGGTPMGAAIELGIDLLASRQAQYRSNGVTPYRPMAFLITDGLPTDRWEKAAQRVQQGEERRKFSFFAVGVDGAAMDTLARISVAEPVMLRGLRFEDMFRWLSSSLSAVSRSTAGTPVALANPAGPAGWATIV